MSEDDIFGFEPYTEGAPYRDPQTIPFDYRPHRVLMHKFIVLTVCASWLIVTCGVLVLLDRHPHNAGMQVIGVVNILGMPLRLLIAGFTSPAA